MSFSLFFFFFVSLKKGGTSVRKRKGWGGGKAKNRGTEENSQSVSQNLVSVRVSYELFVMTVVPMSKTFTLLNYSL